jgi:phosphoribosylaminoimidazole carboxylase PurE protein
LFASSAPDCYHYRQDGLRHDKFRRLKYCNLKFEEKQMVSENKSAVYGEPARPEQGRRVESIAVVMGSDSDMTVMQSCIDVLKDFGIEPMVRVISAHRTPNIAAEFAENAAKNGIKVIIAAAGMAAHLAGALASRTTLPVIGVPLISSSGLEGIDAFLSTVQMPAGVPVATVAIGKAGAKNAAILAVQILALSNEGLAEKLAEFKKQQTKKIVEKDSELRKL